MNAHVATAFEEALAQEEAEANRMPGDDDFMEHSWYDVIWRGKEARVVRDPHTFACRFQYHATPQMSFDFSLWSEVGEMCRPMFADFLAKYRLFDVTLFDDIATGAKRKRKERHV